jgi:hypothetical protein
MFLQFRSDLGKALPYTVTYQLRAILIQVVINDRFGQIFGPLACPVLGFIEPSTGRTKKSLIGGAFGLANQQSLFECFLVEAHNYWPDSMLLGIPTGAGTTPTEPG